MKFCQSTKSRIQKNQRVGSFVVCPYAMNISYITIASTPTASLPSSFVTYPHPTLSHCHAKTKSLSFAQGQKRRSEVSPERPTERKSKLVPWSPHLHSHYYYAIIVSQSHIRFNSSIASLWSTLPFFAASSRIAIMRSFVLWPL